MSKFYLTTPLYYVNDIPHIGHAYTTIAADVLARYWREKGEEVFFLTGTDEHGQKIAQAALQSGKGEQEFVDEIVGRFKSAWKTLNISYDDFIRTSEERHIKVVQLIFEKLKEQGDIYKGTYEGYYCVPCELHVSSHEAPVMCPDCGRAAEKIKEETYFFKQSKYQAQLLKFIENNPEFIQPSSRRNEMLQFLKHDLRDLSVTRTNFKWGVSVPSDDKHVVYVWFDALINYISALGYPDGEKFKKFWPADAHLMGKEIVRFHAITWPCMLMALDLPLPKKIFGHGWWTVEGEKMSKSKGNVVDPLVLCSRFGVDAVRYFILREVAFGADGDFSMQSFVNRYNADLANDLGNLVQRTLTMVEKYFESRVPSLGSPVKDVLIEQAMQLPEKVAKQMQNLAFADALAEIWSLISAANVYIEQKAPWKLVKEGKNNELTAVLSNLINVIYIVGKQIAPFMPNTAAAIAGRVPERYMAGTKIAGNKIKKGDPLFPRKEK